MRITFITGHLCKERHALLNELALDLGECGAEVTVLTGYPSRRISDEVRQYYLGHPTEQISDRCLLYLQFSSVSWIYRLQTRAYCAHGVQRTGPFS